MAYKEKKSGIVGKIVAVILAVAIVAASVCVLGHVSRGDNGRWFSKSDFSQWSWNQSISVKDEESGAIISGSEGAGMSLMSTRVALAEYETLGINPEFVHGVFNLSVEYTPADTTYQNTTFTVGFKNQSSTWASGKNISDYATISQPSAGSKTATLTILKAFSEQVIVTATCDKYSNIKANATVDFVKEIKSINADWQLQDIHDNVLQSVTFGEGTIAPTGGYVSVGLAFASADVGTYWQNASIVHDYSFDETGKFTENFRIIDVLMENAKLGHATEQEFFKNYSDYFLQGSTPDEASQNADVLCGINPIKSVQTHRNYNAVSMTEQTITLDSTWDEGIALYDYSVFEIVPTGITVNHSHIIAG